MHVTQKNVILKLMYAESLRYSDIKPEGMSGNQFKYHLDSLIARKLVKKEASLYTLTDEGKNYIEQVSQRTGNRTRQPKVVVQVIIKPEDDTLVIHKQERQPFPGTWNIPYAKVNFHETALETAARICKRYEIQSPTFKLLVTADVLYQNKDAILSSQIRMVFELQTPLKGAIMLPEKSQISKNDNLPLATTPGMLEILKAVDKNEQYIELRFEKE